VRNNGTGPTNTRGTIDVRDTLADGGDVQETTIGGFPVLAAGETFRAVIPITVDTEYERRHRLTLRADSRNEIPETNEGDNSASRDYTLDQGDCD